MKNFGNMFTLNVDIILSTFFSHKGGVIEMAIGYLAITLNVKNALQYHFTHLTHQIKFN